MVGPSGFNEILSLKFASLSGPERECFQFTVVSIQMGSRFFLGDIQFDLLAFIFR